jgi:RNA polymerase sigma-70 factor (ECF subfamily)
VFPLTLLKPRAASTVREVFDEYAGYVWRTFRHLGIPEADVPDLCQEVFVVVHRKLGEFEGRSSVKTWLYGICVRVASDHRRRAHVRNERAQSDAGEQLSSSQSFGPDARAEARAQLQSLLAELDDDKRTVLVLYELEGLTMKEIAEIVGCPLQTAYSRLHAARARLLEVLTAARERGSEP